MTTFCKTVIPKADYKEKEVRENTTVVRFDPVEVDGQIECAECVVDNGYDEEVLQGIYDAWKQKCEAVRLKSVKSAKFAEIDDYDVSDNVNNFIIKHGGMQLNYWLPAVTRNQLKNSVGSWANSHDTYKLDLREYGVSLDIPCDSLLAMLQALEDYAVACFNTTSAHMAAVNKLTTVSEVENYDITADYPQQLEFEL